MQVSEADEPMSEIQAAGLGVGAGIIAGVGLGILITMLLGGSFEMACITVVHAVFAMILMGAWLAPALLVQPTADDSQPELPSPPA